MESEEKFQNPSPIPLNTNSDDLYQKDETINDQTENNQQKSFNKQTKEFLISRFKIILILKKSNIINDDIISKAQTDLILTKIKPNHNKYKFIDFMNFLTEICKYIFKENYEKNPKQYLSKFFDYLINNYYEFLDDLLKSNYIETETDNNCTINSIKKIIDTDIEKHALEIDDKYSKETKMINSLENFISCAKDFDIIPYLINEKNLATYFNLLLKHQKKYGETINELFLSLKMEDNKKFEDIGTCFKLSSLILFLYHFSILSYYKKFKIQFSINNLEKPLDIEIILFFLQKLENSKGISKYILKRQRTNEDKFTFIPTNENIELVLKELSEDNCEKIPVITIANDYNYNYNINFTSSISPIGMSSVNSPKKIILTNTNNSFENNNILETKSDFNNINNIIKFPETTKNKNRHKGEEICKESKNYNELINKRLIKELNSTSINLDNSINLKNTKKQKNNILKLKTLYRNKREY